MDNFNFNRDFFDCCTLAGDEAKDLAWALLRYGYEGIEPEGLSDLAQAVFLMAKGRLDAMVRGSKGGKAKASNQKDSSRDTCEVTSQDPSSPSPKESTEDSSLVSSLDPSQVPMWDASQDPSLQKEKEKEIVPTVQREKYKKEKVRPEQDPSPYGEIVGYLNAKTGRNFNPDAKATKRCIKARWNEGYRLDDFKTVVDGKSAEWLGDPKMANYVKPDTLFSEKFDGYLNTAPLAAKAKQHTGTLGGSHAPDYSREGW